MTERLTLLTLHIYVYVCVYSFSDSFPLQIIT